MPVEDMKNVPQMDGYVNCIMISNAFHAINVSQLPIKKLGFSGDGRTGKFLPENFFSAKEEKGCSKQKIISSRSRRPPIWG